jgi:hypothetical protein
VLATTGDLSSFSRVKGYHHQEILELTNARRLVAAQFGHKNLTLVLESPMFMAPTSIEVIWAALEFGKLTSKPLTKFTYCWLCLLFAGTTEDY